jgi:hypothetical protein
MLDPESAAAVHPAGLDAPTRLRILADRYGLSPQEHGELPGVIEPRALSERGGWHRWDRVQGWLVTHRDVFAAALPD